MKYTQRLIDHGVAGAAVSVLDTPPAATETQFRTTVAKPPVLKLHAALHEVQSANAQQQTIIAARPPKLSVESNVIDSSTALDAQAMARAVST